MIIKDIKLWSEDDYEPCSDGFVPYMNCYLWDDDKVRPAIVVCPGGGYTGRAYHEDEPIAMAWVAKGYNAFVVEYSVAPKCHPQPLLDLSEAICIIRNNAEEWHINPKKIAVTGFSAGGHLACSSGVLGSRDYILNKLEEEEGKNLPDAMILCYPVISSDTEISHAGSFNNLAGENKTDELLLELSLEKQVTPKTPPTFLWHTADDAVVPVENSLEFAKSLRKNKVDFELHVYPNGSHGLGLSNDDKHVGAWFDSAVKWLDKVFSK